jgi:hypothetical protein
MTSYSPFLQACYQYEAGGSQLRLSAYDHGPTRGTQARTRAQDIFSAQMLQWRGAQEYSSIGISLKMTKLVVYEVR